ncbi:hypothetical protein AXW37_17385 [Yersinia ruckeri]|uniref:hypothetical protein n=1 Tax=Yersinia ruckeri TaxID=29486 RepID=UPI0008FE3EA1|nr:hypothetical protein [Yersinia ruckeri]OJC56744.1 hypothetical protein AXW37_17385 [Yersinia ruckeri]OJC84742.1 hypothetical protein AXW45_17460 [Yersinia ruckeri]OJC85223.1 hypothetical protein AXW45_17525 [Yersinia ruckeri]
MSKVISIRIDDELATELEYQAACEGITLTEYSREILKSYASKNNYSFGIYALEEILSGISDNKKSKEKVRSDLERIKEMAKKGMDKMPHYNANEMFMYLYSEYKKQ